MTKPCRKVLNNLRKLSDNTEDVLSYLRDTSCICLYDDVDRIYDYSKYKNEIYGIIKQLVTDGYLQYYRAERLFTLTHKGLHPHQFQWEIFKSFFFKSILVPVGVSFVTTLLTLLAQWLLTTP